MLLKLHAKCMIRVTLNAASFGQFSKHKSREETIAFPSFCISVFMLLLGMGFFNIKYIYIYWLVTIFASVLPLKGCKNIFYSEFDHLLFFHYFRNIYWKTITSVSAWVLRRIQSSKWNWNWTEELEFQMKHLEQVAQRGHVVSV